MNILAIDPSIRACGVCLLDSEAKWIEALTIRPRTDGDLPIRTEDLVGRLWAFLCLYPGTFTHKAKLVIEWPTFQNTERGRTAAVSGNINTLAFVCGAISQALVSTVETIQLVTPQQWKGMESKDKTRERVLTHPLGKKLKDDVLDHNAFDAVGLALWRLEKRPKFNLSQATIVIVRRSGKPLILSN